jgi:hypothetical protein
MSLERAIDHKLSITKDIEECRTTEEKQYFLDMIADLFDHYITQKKGLRIGLRIPNWSEISYNRDVLPDTREDQFYFQMIDQVSKRRPRPLNEKEKENFMNFLRDGA